MPHAMMLPMPRWLLYSLLALAILGVWGLLNGPASRALEPMPLHVFSTIGLLPVAVPLLLTRGLGAGSGRAAGFAFAFAAGLSGGLGNIAVTAALKGGGEVSVVMPLTAMYPLATVMVARLLFRERLNAIQSAGIALALGSLAVSGVLAARDAGETAALAGSWWRRAAAPWLAYALAALVLWGFTGIFQKLAIRRISNALSTIAFTAAFVAIAAGIAFGSAGFRWRISAEAWGLALAYGALLGLATLSLFAAYRGGKAAVVTGVSALYPALTVLLAALVLGERIDLLKGALVALAVLAAIALTYETPPREAPR
jgi:transporter family protein